MYNSDNQQPNQVDFAMKLRPQGYLDRLINKLFARKGMQLLYDGRKWSKNKLFIRNLKIVRKKDNTTLIYIAKTLIIINIWKIFKLQFNGRCLQTGITVSHNSVSNKPFYVNSLFVLMQLRRKKRSLSFKINDIIAHFQLKITKQLKEANFYIPQLSWKQFSILFHDHLYSDFLKNLNSENIFSLKCYNKREKKGRMLFKAKIDHNKEMLFEENNHLNLKSTSTIDKEFLFELAINKFKNLNQEDYVLFDNIPKRLVDCFIFSEDIVFWNHKGMHPFFIGYALNHNLDEGKISRGGSTITMQLVKNIFLHNERTITRKVEEGIITLLLENYYKVDKKSIFELYINIIEFTEKIRGIHSACRFFFNKNYDELTLAQMLTLTYIIPRPLFILEAIEMKSAQLKTNLRKHIEEKANLMLSHNIIDNNEYNSINYKIEFAPNIGILELQENKFN